MSVSIDLCSCPQLVFLVEPRPCLSVCVCVARKRFLRNCWSVHRQTWHSTVTASDMRMHHILIILTLTFIQGHTDQNENNVLLFKKLNYSSNAHQVCCEDSLTKGLHDHCQSDDLDSRSQVGLTLNYFLTCDVSDNVTAIEHFKLGMTVDLWMP